MDTRRIEQLLVSLSESISSNRNDTNLRLNSLENKIRDLQDFVSDSIGKLNQQLNKTNNNQQLKQKEESVKEKLTQEVKSTKIIPKESLDMLNGMPRISDFMDKFLFGSEKEQMMFESLCHKWTIKNFDEMQVEKDFLSDKFLIEEYDFKAHLKLKYLPNGQVYFHFCIEARLSKGEEMDPALVTIIVKDSSGRKDKEHILNYSYHYVARANPFYMSDNWMEIKKDNLDKLISPTDRSLEILFIVKPPTYFSQLQSVNGTVTDTITRIRDKIKLGHMLHHGHWSPPFKTHPDGCKVNVKICLNKLFVGKKQGLRALIHFFPRGNFPCKINHKVTITLFNPIEGRKNIIITKEVKSADDLKINIGNTIDIQKRGFYKYKKFTYKVQITSIM